MPNFNVLTPGTKVQIVPFAGCENENSGVIIQSCLDKCCQDATGNMPFCEKYVVEYDFKACTNCSKQTSTFCRSDLIEIP